MANGPEIATAYLTLVPTLKGAGKTIGRELNGSDVRTAATRAGQGAGSRMGAGLKSAIGVALASVSVGAIARFATDAVASFSELEDSSAAASVVFGKNMGAIIKQSQGASKSMGLSQQQVISAANTFGTYGKAAGLSGKELSAFATEQTQLAADMASFKGTSPEQAIEAIGAALRGEMEPIRTYGVLLDDNTLRQEAFRMGLVSTTKDALTPQVKTLAAQSAIFKQTTDAQGDFARTSTSTANVQKTLAAETGNLSAKFGKVLAPAFTWARKKALVFVSAISGLLDRILSFQGAIAAGASTTGLVRALGLDPRKGLGNVVRNVIIGVSTLVAAFKTGSSEVTATGFAGVMQSIGNGLRTAFDAIKGAIAGGDFSGAGANLGAIMDVVRPFGSVLAGAAGALGDVAFSVGEVIGSGIKLLPGLLEGMGDAAAWLADHQGVLNAILVAAAAGFVAVKAGQAAANAAALLSIPLKVAEVAANFALAGSNRALIAARKTDTAAALTNQGAAKAGIAMRAREAAAAAFSVGKTLALSGAQKVAAATQWLLNAAMLANPIVLIIAGIVLLVAGLIWFFTKTKLGQKIIKVAWAGIQAAVKAVVDWWKNTALPAIKKFFGGISKVMGKVIEWVKTNWPLLLAIILGPILGAVFLVIKNWSKIKAAFKAVWEWVKTNVFDKIKAFFGKGGPLRTTFTNMVVAVATIFAGIQGKFRAVWDWVRQNVFDKITAFLGKGGPLRTAFTNVKTAIGKIWEGLKELAAKPINFVLETVYNDGIREWVGDLFGFFKQKNPLPKATPIAFARGSEDHRAQIARGGAMRLWAEPETGGEAYIPLAASKRGRSTEILSRVAQKFGYGLTQYAGGGFFGDAADFLRGPIDYVKGKAGAVIADKFGTRSGGVWDLVKQLPRMLVGPLATYAKNKLASIFGGEPGGAKYDGKAAGAMGWQRQWDIVKKAHPTAQLHSAYRPGAVTAVGTPSYHGLGRAIDITPSMAIFDWLARSFPGSTELIFSPANNRQIYKGQKTLFGEPTRGDHFDHIHWAMANGGILPGVYDRGGWLPAGGVGVNLTGRPEAVLSPDESAGLKAMLARPARAAEYHFHTTRVTPRDVVQAERLHELRTWAGAGA